MSGVEPLLIAGGDVVTPREVLRGGNVLVEGGRIAAVGSAKDVPAPAAARVVEVPGRRVLPGLIETHAHGLCGRECSDGAEALKQMRLEMLRFGVTSFLPTSICGGEKEVRELAGQVREAAGAETGGAEVLGIHLEGPFFNTDYGAFPNLHDALPDADGQRSLVESLTGIARIVTLSPELDGAPGFIRLLREAGIVAGIGHSGATEEEFRAAVDAGASHVIHLFNAMRRRSHAEPGCEGPGLSDLVLTEARVTAELIADGVHVQPGLLRLALHAKGPKGLVLITDSMKAAGLGPGCYELRGGLQVVSDGRSCRTAAEGVLAGSVLTLNRGVRNMVELGGASLCDAVYMATLGPARLIGVQGRKGSIEPGKDADVCIADEQMEVEMTVAAGRVAYRRSGESG